MIEAFKKFNEKYPNVQLIILGDGKERNNLINISNQNIHFL
jgi:glycosyltransferase involved in cell wall biosynthesis